MGGGKAMGLNIVVHDTQCKKHPDWDCVRHGHDEEFTRIIDCRQIEVGAKGEWYNDDDFRPTNITELRDKIEKTWWENKKRYLDLLDIIEKDTEKRWWIYFSR